MDPSLRLWNFTRQAVGEVLEGSRETAVEYRLFVPRMSEAQDARLITVVTYMDPALRAARLSAATAFNASLTFAGNPLPVDARVFLPYALAAATVIGAARLVQQLVSGSSRSKAAAAETGAGASAGEGNELELSVVPSVVRKRKARAD